MKFGLARRVKVGELYVYWSGKHSINDFMNSNMSAEWENSTLDHVDTPPASVEETASTVCFDLLEFLKSRMKLGSPRPFKRY